jgi:hypothetical protein
LNLSGGNPYEGVKEEDLAKSGYKMDTKYKSLIILLYLWLHIANQIIEI